MSAEVLGLFMVSLDTSIPGGEQDMEEMPPLFAEQQWQSTAFLHYQPLLQLLFSGLQHVCSLHDTHLSPSFAVFCLPFSFPTSPHPRVLPNANHDDHDQTQVLGGE